MEEDELVKQKADTTFLGACVRLAPQLWYNQKVTAARPLVPSGLARARMSRRGTLSVSTVYPSTR